MNQLFDPETGFLLMDEWVQNRESFRKIIEDQIVTDVELADQSARVIGLLRKIDEQLTQDDKKLVFETLAEMAVLQVVTQVYQIQETKKFY